MAAPLLKFLYLVVILAFLALMIQGISISGAQQCSANDVLVEQTKTGAIVLGKPEFQVTLFNACPCPQANVKLSCKGFKTAEKIDPKVLVVAEKECRLPAGSFIAPFSGYVFNYAWNSQFPFKPIFSEAQCLSFKVPS